MTGLYRIRGIAGQAKYRNKQDVRNAKIVLLKKKEIRKQKRYVSSRHAELSKLKEYNTAPVSRVRDSKSSTKLGISLEIDIATATAAELARLVKSVGSTVKPVELE